MARASSNRYITFEKEFQGMNRHKLFENLVFKSYSYS